MTISQKSKVPTSPKASLGAGKSQKENSENRIQKIEIKKESSVKQNNKQQVTSNPTSLKTSLGASPTSPKASLGTGKSQKENLEEKIQKIEVKKTEVKKVSSAKQNEVFRQVQGKLIKEENVEIKKMEVKEYKGSGRDYRLELPKMLEAGMHFGHLAKRWHPKMGKYIWQRKGDVHIFDLLKTNDQLQKACEAVEKMVAEGKNVLFVGTKRQASPVIKEEAKRIGVPYVAARWPGGMLSNWEQVKKSIARLNELRDGLSKGKFNKYTKKERVLMDREQARLERLFGGIVEMKTIPDVLFVIDPSREKSAIKESRANKMTIFAIADSNCDPDLVDYIIPANDDAVRSVKLLVEKFASAVMEGKNWRLANNK